jgi:hypothetical protein
MCFPQRPAVHGQVGHRAGPRECVQADHLHVCCARRAERPTDGAATLVDVRRELLPLLRLQPLHPVTEQPNSGFEDLGACVAEILSDAAAAENFEPHVPQLLGESAEI